MSSNDGSHLTVYGRSFRQHDSRTMQQILREYRRSPSNPNDRAALFTGIHQLSRELPEAENQGITNWVLHGGAFPVPVSPQVGPSVGSQDMNAMPFGVSLDPSALHGSQTTNGPLIPMTAVPTDPMLNPHFPRNPVQGRHPRGPLYDPGFLRGRRQYGPLPDPPYVAPLSMRGRGRRLGEEGDENDSTGSMNSGTFDWVLPRPNPIHGPPRLGPRRPYLDPGARFMAMSGAGRRLGEEGEATTPPAPPLPTVQQTYGIPRHELPNFLPGAVRRERHIVAATGNEGEIEFGVGEAEDFVMRDVSVQEYEVESQSGDDDDDENMDEDDDVDRSRWTGIHRRHGHALRTEGIETEHIEHAGQPHIRGNRRVRMEAPTDRGGQEAAETLARMGTAAFPPPLLPPARTRYPVAELHRFLHPNNSDDDLSDGDESPNEPTFPPPTPNIHNSRRDTNTRPHPAPLPDENLRECFICCDTLPFNRYPEKPEITDRCIHRHPEQWVCLRCLSEHIRVLVNAQEWYRLKCPMCDGKLEQDDIKKYAQTSVYHRYLEYLHTTQEHYTPCLGPNCGKGQTHPPSLGPKMICNTCTFATCTKDCVPWHEGLTCSEFAVSDAQLERLENELATAKLLAKERDETRICPSCKQGITKTEGCDHLMCRCGQEYCFICMTSWENILRHGPTAHALTCTAHPRHIPISSSQLTSRSNLMTNLVHGGEVSEEVAKAMREKERKRREELRPLAAAAAEARERERVAALERARKEKNEGSGESGVGGNGSGGGSERVLGVRGWDGPPSGEGGVKKKTKLLPAWKE